MNDKEILEFLNYQGPIYLRETMTNNPDRKTKPNLLTTTIRFCPIHATETKHERVRDLDTVYWRCYECLMEQIRRYGFFTPPHKRGKKQSSLFPPMNE